MAKQKSKITIPSELKLAARLLDGSVGIECRFCEGSGIYPSDYIGDDFIETEPCPVCKGSAINIVPDDSQVIVSCRYCGATGRGWNENGYFSGDPCKVCKGTGYVNLSEFVSGPRVSEAPTLWSLIHPAINGIAKSRFDTGHYADAVEAAFKHFNSTVKAKVRGLVPSDLDGASLMTRVFSLDNPILSVADLSTDTGKNIQKGYLQMFAGGITGIRNPKAHENLSISAERAIHLLFLASLFMYKLDESTRV